MHYEGRARSARKLMLALAGRPSEPAPGHKLVSTCGNPRCVRPEHLAIISFATLTAADVRELRRAGNTETAAQAAARLGVSVGHINDIRQWRVWREHTASPWAGLGARRS